MTVDDIKTLSVADIRHTTGLSQEAFAAYWRCSKRTVQNWEGRGCPLHIKLMMAQALGILKRES